MVEILSGTVFKLDTCSCFTDKIKNLFQKFEKQIQSFRFCTRDAFSGLVLN